MQRDVRGLEITTSSPEAAGAFGRAVDAYPGWRTDAMRELSDALEADPRFTLAHAVKGLFLLGLRKPEIASEAEECLAAARENLDRANPRESRYVATLESMLAGRTLEAATALEAVAIAHPLDLFALRIVQFELFWIGEVAWMRDISESAAPRWSAETPGYGHFLSVRAFGLEENADYPAAERAAREAVERDPTDCWGAHALSHVLVMQARHREGIDWLESLRGHWAHANHIVHHLWWHLCVHHCEIGEYEAPLEVYDQSMRNPESPLIQAMPDFYVDLQNAAALLLRLELRGVDVGDRWGEIADLCEQRIGNHTSPFTSAHCGLALAAAGRDEKLDELLKAMEDFASTDEGTMGPRYRAAVLPACRAASAHRRDDHREVLRHLLPARRSLWQTQKCTSLARVGMSSRQRLDVRRHR